MKSTIGTAVGRFLHWESEQPDAVFLRQAFQGKWLLRTWKDAGQEVRRIASYLRSLSLPAHSNIAILSKNCAHWILSDLAVWMSGHVSVPLYPTLAARDIRQILEHSESRVIFLGKLDHYDSQKSGLPESIHRISFPDYGPNEGTAWGDVTGRDPSEPFLPASEDLATIIYTSGTTGKPKGVMVTFGAFNHVTSSALQDLDISNPGEHFFSYLPLSHIAERMLVEMGTIYSGATVSFSESLEKFPHNLMETQPTVFLAVPRIWSKFQEKILEKAPQNKLNKLLPLPWIGSLVRKKIRKSLGLSRARWIFTGSAPMRTSLFEWFDRLGIVIHDVYGMTENLAYSHANTKDVKYGTAGKKWKDVEVRFSEEGEIEIRHAGMMKGYYKEPELTAGTFTGDGFLKTGDLGVLDSAGFLHITGRVKDQFKTDKGKYIDPSPIELILQKNTDIEHVCVVGTGLPQPIALMTLSSGGKSSKREDVTGNLEDALRKLNQGLQSYEQLEKAVILNGEWNVDNGLMTPTMKVKRVSIERMHRSNYVSWYERTETVVWENPF